MLTRYDHTTTQPDFPSTSDGIDIDLIVQNTAASLTENTLTITQTIVSHTTEGMENISSILNDGIRLKSHQGNLYGGQAFYVAQSGYSVNEVGGTHAIAFRLSNRPKIYDTTFIFTSYTESGNKLAKHLKNMGYDAIKYENSYRGYNLAIINNARNLTPTGVYPVLPTSYNAISLPTIRGIQFLGALGSGYALYQAGNSIIASEEPSLEFSHQAILFSAAYLGGIQGGTAAILPCAAVGAICPVAAPFTVPVCVAGGSILGGFAATSITEFTLHVLGQLIDKNTFLRYGLRPLISGMQQAYRLDDERFEEVHELNEREESASAIVPI